MNAEFRKKREARYRVLGLRYQDLAPVFHRKFCLFVMDAWLLNGLINRFLSPLAIDSLRPNA